MATQRGPRGADGGKPEGQVLGAGEPKDAWKPERGGKLHTRMNALILAGHLLALIDGLWMASSQDAWRLRSNS